MTVRSQPRDRLVDAATRLFYREGLHTVGVDRLVAEASITRATFYRHFPSKDDLVVAYLDRVDGDLREAVTAATAGVAPPNAVEALVGLIGRTVCSSGFRGCHFINAAAEYPDPAHSVRQAVERHRLWFRATVTQLARAAGHPDPDYAGQALSILHDGALVGGELDDPRTISSTLERLVREMFSQ
ncbi:TetR/AcrR family transcriptional regulator [Jatrophihabitans lederbergiae]|uniref:TetR/AcrR family transcriptional regulator n=1 Tax=Jatrophihabitans lederbergiae TaxID=3075547 RepID=A0ABU2JEE1_9ACTN|nr:TetR/AcrR family transcriptional regulator [Jatrophihabitans sp. DSM 44399]MDT0263352.1 TetR/AcrR family transcriptional regulator [Jatrophihabitans sp. DSM 44399]